MDQRMESLAKPIARFKYTLTLPKGWTSISTKLAGINGELKQITFKTPALGGHTARLYLYDEIGSEHFDGGAKTQSSDHKLIAAATHTYLAGTTTLTITVAGAQATDVTFYVLIYLE